MNPSLLTITYLQSRASKIDAKILTLELEKRNIEIMIANLGKQPISNSDLNKLLNDTDKIDNILDNITLTKDGIKPNDPLDHTDELNPLNHNLLESSKLTNGSNDKTSKQFGVSVELKTGASGIVSDEIKPAPVPVTKLISVSVSKSTKNTNSGVKKGQKLELGKYFIIPRQFRIDEDSRIIMRINNTVVSNDELSKLGISRDLILLKHDLKKDYSITADTTKIVFKKTGVEIGPKTALYPGTKSYQRYVTNGEILPLKRVYQPSVTSASKLPDGVYIKEGQFYNKITKKVMTIKEVDELLDKQNRRNLGASVSADAHL